MQRHNLTHSEERPHVCQTCNSTFKILSNLRKHERIHEGKKQYSCTVAKCMLAFVKKTQLYNHLKTEHGFLAPFACELCNANYTTQSHLRRHKERTHFSHYMCTDCGEMFDKFSTLNRHISKLHKKRSHCVQEDTKTQVLTPEQVRATQHNASKSQPEKNCDMSQPEKNCDMLQSDKNCDMSQSDKNCDMSRDASSSSSRPSSSLECETCHKTLKSKSLLTLHLKKVHNKVIKTDYQCSECMALFSHKPNLVTHMLSKHEGVKRFSCKECPAQFYYKHALQRHTKAIHSGKERVPRIPWNKISDMERMSGHIVDDRVREYVNTMKQLGTRSNELLETTDHLQPTS